MVLFNQITIIGIGLIGGSLASAIKEADICKKIVGVDINPDSLKIALKRGIIDDGFEDINKGISNADLIIIAVPVGEASNILEELKLHAPKNCLLVDVGSTKEKIINKAKEIMKERPDLSFIGGHPMTGSEKWGVRWSSSDLFQNSPFILVPINLEDYRSDRLSNFVELLNGIGASVRILGEKEHDWKVGYISHLPHLVSSAMVNLIAQNDDYEQILELAGGGFKDTTRIAGSNSKMWVDICLSNQEKLEQILHEFIDEISQLKLLLSREDKQGLLDYFNRASKIKNNEKLKIKGDSDQINKIFT